MTLNMKKMHKISLVLKIIVIVIKALWGVALKCLALEAVKLMFHASCLETHEAYASSNHF